MAWLEAGVLACGTVASVEAWLLPCAKLVAAYMVTPLAKEAWVALAEPLFGVPAPLAVLLFLFAETCVVLVVLFVFPIDWLTNRFAPKIERFEQRVRASRVASNGLAFALAGIIALPFHSGGAILGTLAGRTLGLPRLHAYLAVIGGWPCASLSFSWSI